MDDLRFNWWGGGVAATLRVSIYRAFLATVLVVVELKLRTAGRWAIRRSDSPPWKERQGRPGHS